MLNPQYNMIVIKKKRAINVFKIFYLERFGFIPIISYKITSVEQNKNTNIIHNYYTPKTENTIMNHD